MQKNKTEGVYIRDDGWVFSEEGMKRLREGGYRGNELKEKSFNEQLGNRYRVLKPLDRDAAVILKGVKGVVGRAKFISEAIVAEYKRRNRG